MIGLAVLAGYWWMTRSDAGPMAADSVVLSTSVPPSPASRAATLPVEVAAVPAVPAPASPTELPTEKLAEQVKVAMEIWRNAGSERDMVAYLGAYSDSFVPADGTTHEARKTSRHRTIGGRDAIEVTIRNQNVESRDKTRAQVSFLQD